MVKKAVLISFSSCLSAMPIVKRKTFSSSFWPSKRPRILIVRLLPDFKSPSCQILFPERVAGLESEKIKPKPYSALSKRFSITFSELEAMETVNSKGKPAEISVGASTATVTGAELKTISNFFSLNNKALEPDTRYSTEMAISFVSFSWPNKIARISRRTLSPESITPTLSLCRKSSLLTSSTRRVPSGNSTTKLTASIAAGF